MRVFEHLRAWGGDRGVTMVENDLLAALRAVDDGTVTTMEVPESP